ncbi:RAD55 family ATPase [Effusibacillus lacus]|uniref:Circadian clock protein KaiC n=1 Tax=Effusibacillus lacus TaxID=1348429 RepID=A0A292YPR9_9BACL|nr:ATPase domain-containing protein [Effusibacillus lacus]TCS76844.1 circadian clock protein KaiC [Effusibacillus lacus]GAX91176.1 circadian clock protein KaiC [Effusibacillus lacus]
MHTTISSGIAGLDYILDGGFPESSSIILEGAPGTGKTTLGLQFLYRGAVFDNEPGIYITFEELPEQLYKEMAAFGWDLRQLEKDNRIRVICISPEVLLEQMMTPGGLFEQIVNEIQCRRVVIDSISLFQYGKNNQDLHRKTIYSLRNILRKFSLTSLLIREQDSIGSGEVPFENYVADGVIRLSLQVHLEKYRKRTLEVLKMRGKKILEGEHIYKFTQEGIHLIPALSMVEDKTLANDPNVIATGFSALDKALSGGIRGGSVFILDTNSKANYKYLLASIYANRILAGERTVALLASSTTISDLQHLIQLYGVSLEEEAKQRKVFFIEHYSRPVPPAFEPVVVNVNGLDNEEYVRKRRETLAPIMGDSIERGEKWFAYYDLNTIFSERGKEYVMNFFAEEAARARAYGITVLVLCNFAEIGEATASFLERTCSGVIRTWVDGNYQYLQVTKSPNGRMSEPFVVESIPEKPFIRLV